MSAVYTIGNGKRHQFAKRQDGTWFVRSFWRGQWGKWMQHGPKKPYEFGMYLVPHASAARLP